MGYGIEPRNDDVVEAEASCASKATCVVPQSRGAITPPGSRAISRAKGSCRNLGDPVTSAGMVIGGSQQGSWMHRGWKSDRPMLPLKPWKETTWWREGAGRRELRWNWRRARSQRWQPLLPNLQRVNAAALTTGRTRFTALLHHADVAALEGHSGGSGARRALGSIGYDGPV